LINATSMRGKVPASLRDPTWLFGARRALTKTVLSTLCVSLQATSTNENNDRRFSWQASSCNDPSVRSISLIAYARATLFDESSSPFLLLPSSSVTTESSDDMRSSSEATSLSNNMHSSRETTSPPSNVVTTTGCSETTATIGITLTTILDACAEETYGNMHAEHSVTASIKEEIQPCNADSRSSLVPSQHCMSHQAADNGEASTRNHSTIGKPHVANILSLPAVDRKVSVEADGENEISTYTSPSLVTVARCGKNKGNRARFISKKI